MSDAPLPEPPDSPSANGVATAVEPPRPWTLLSDDEIDNLPDPEWMIDGIFTNGFTVLYGASGSYKSFVALDWALSITTNRVWQGHRPVASAAVGLPTSVIYVSGEGASGMAKRRSSWRMKTGTDTAGWYLIAYAVNLLDPWHVRLLEADVYASGAKLVIVDTLARSLVGGDENSAQDMGRAIAALDHIRHRHGCATLVVHHTGTEQTRPRGSTALFAAADTVVNCVAEGQAITLLCKKQKDAAPFRPINLRAQPYGDSVALVPGSHTPLRPGGNGNTFTVT